MNTMESIILNLFGEDVDPTAVTFLSVFLIFYLLALVFLIVSYVLNSVGMHTIAKRRGIHNPWLAWIPVASSWVLGSISDHYQFVAKGKNRHRRMVLLGMNIAIAMIPIVVFVGEIMLLLAINKGNSAGALDEMSIGLFFVLWLCMAAFIIVNAVFTYMALYDLYHSCNPDNAVVFLILSIFINVTLPFFVFGCRKKDFGMPLRNQSQEPLFHNLQPAIQAESVEVEYFPSENIETE